MHSEFYNVALDRIRYSLVWEDSNTLYKGLELQPDDQVLVITSAGCNVLNALLKAPASVTAIDLNPVQNKLLLLKKQLILNYDYVTFRALLGLDGPEKVTLAWHQSQATLPEDMRRYWSPFFQSHPNGLMAAGKLETYLNGFYGTLNSSLQEKLKQLITFNDVEAQHRFFLKELHSTPFQKQFTFYFDEANLSKGRDPKLFKYAAESGGAAFYQRLLAQVASVLVRDNFFFRFFFFGAVGIPPELLPPCYQEQNFTLLQEQLHKLKVVNAEAIDYLLSQEGKHINKASLSNIFEYTSHEEFEQVYQRLFADPVRNLRMIFWNLLQEQGAGIAADNWLNAPLSAALSKTDACFYFRNVRVQANVCSETSASCSA
ncbi:DUF3419 family protein [Pontibacter pamirensis]|uniref:DUF3419 family protein n=1 Tax=Pontibacter pamirensis TaxID=2562824 RepID=UPI00138A0DCA|nr:DUF3419 family protein [Pontibacter pamirensis]